MVVRLEADTTYGVHTFPYNKPEPDAEYAGL
jgi:hypothetical protein